MTTTMTTATLVQLADDRYAAATFLRDKYRVVDALISSIHHVWTTCDYYPTDEEHWLDTLAEVAMLAAAPVEFCGSLDHAARAFWALTEDKKATLHTVCTLSTRPSPWSITDLDICHAGLAADWVHIMNARSAEGLEVARALAGGAE